MNLNQDKIITLTILSSSIDNYSIQGMHNPDKEIAHSCGEQDIFVSGISRVAHLSSGRFQGKTLVVLKESMEHCPVLLIVKESRDEIKEKINQATAY